MRIFARTKFDSLVEATKAPADCKSLHLLVKENLKYAGQFFIKLENLRELFIRGDVSVYHDDTFELPEEIGQLKKIEKLTLLNLPVKDFPQWILYLKRLKYLMIRGTDVQILPGSVKLLSELKTLRIENCPLTALPPDLKEMGKLRNLGLSDTKLTTINQETLPPSLRIINLEGTRLFGTEIKINGRVLKPGNV